MSLTSDELRRGWTPPEGKQWTEGLWRLLQSSDLMESLDAETNLSQELASQQSLSPTAVMLRILTKRGLWAPGENPAPAETLTSTCETLSRKTTLLTYRMVREKGTILGCLLCVICYAWEKMNTAINLQRQDSNLSLFNTRTSALLQWTHTILLHDTHILWTVPVLNHLWLWVQD